MTIEEIQAEMRLHGLNEEAEFVGRAVRERDEVLADVAAAAGELLVSIPSPSTDMFRILLANTAMRRERDEARSEAGKLREALEDMIRVDGGKGSACYHGPLYFDARERVLALLSDDKQAREALAAPKPSKPQCPDGWVMVPKEPTMSEMEPGQRAYEAYCSGFGSGRNWSLVPNAYRNGWKAVEAALARPNAPDWDDIHGQIFTIAHDGFTGTVIGSYVTREGKRGVVLQQVETRVVHVYGEKWLSAAPKPPPQTGADNE